MVTLGTITFQATTDTHTMPLTVEVTTLADTTAAPLPWTGTNGAISVSGTPIPDANGDRIVNATDALCILRQIGGFAGTSSCPNPLPFGNVNQSSGANAIDAVDSLCVLRYLGGFAPTTNCPSEPPVGGTAAGRRPA